MMLYCLSVLGVGGCGCPMHSSMCCAGITSLQLINSALASASAADDMTALMFYAIIMTMLLLGGTLELLEMKKCPLALLLVPYLDRYDALLCPTRTMLLAWYDTTTFGWIAA